ncbi:MAG: PQQ-like beta-propeller repeat protein [Pirellulales bacterium]|nr:PQQ-like beta-propeller repeat protein [Pirellulales bacterium]
MRFVTLTLIMSIAMASSRPATCDDWPQWRGPNRDGVWLETGLVERFSSPRLKLRWRAPISSGYSGPTVAGGRVYVTDRIVEPEETERVHCFDWESGRALWMHAYPCRYENVGYTAGPRASVTIDERFVFSLGTMGDLYCLDAATGKVHWKKDLRVDYRIDVPTWGVASAPLVAGRLLIVQAGGANGACILAMDKSGGEEIWRALDDRASYSAPILIDQAGRRVLVCWTGDHVAGLDPESGQIHWKHPFPPKRMVINVATPVVDGDRLFVSAFYDGSLMLRLRQDRLAVEQVWRRCGANERRTDGLHAMISTPCLQGDYVYGVDSYGELRCLDAKTGDRIWEDLTAVPNERWGTIHMVRNGDRMWMFNELGELIIGRLSPSGFEEISRAKLIEPTTGQLPRRDGVCWSHPAYAYKHVFARNDRELVCADLAPEK